jgi:riboflavin kinase/FMN adenylyltransferase
MRVLDFSSASVRALDALPPDTAACLGAFDGMHLGHQALIGRARALASEVAVVTFEPRPAEVLVPERAPPRLQSPHQRERVCRQLGVDTLVILPFDLEVARMQPAAFAEGVLVRGLAPAKVVVGFDFHFGAQRAGGPRELEALLAPAGIEVCVVEKIGLRGAQKLGSTAIREAIDAGGVERAAAMLGRHYALSGKVVHGEARGRELGYPTANIEARELHPRSGVYACYLTELDEQGRERRWWPAVANIGTNPTFGEGRARSLEVHAIEGEPGELYGEEIEVSFVSRLRDEQRFADAAALREAISEDVDAARAILTEEAAALRRAHPVAAEREGAA